MRPLEPMAPEVDVGQPGRVDSNQDFPPDSQPVDVPEPTAPSHRVRARVRYDSANEPLPVVQKRAKALRALAVLVVLAAAWLGYRYFTLNG